MTGRKLPEWTLMRIGLISHPACLQHAKGSQHPERPARLEAVIDGVRQSRGDVVELEAPKVETVDLERVHLPSYISAIERFCESGGGNLDPDTYAVPASWEAALRAAGAVPAALDALESGHVDTAFVAVRPPGHHALQARAMGFCLFNNIVVGAARLSAAGHRVAILDFDVHHGNGSQELIGPDPNVLYLSLHEYPFYPGSGWLDDTGGTRESEGTVVNVPLPPFSAGDVYRAAFERVLEPVTEKFQPDWLLVSAGYDAHDADPLADQRLLAPDYQWMAHTMADIVPANRTVFVLEGGYDTTALRDSVAATLDGLTVPPGELPELRSPERSFAVVDSVERRTHEVWDLA